MKINRIGQLLIVSSAIATALVLSGCSAPQTTSSVAPPLDCLSVSASALETIASGAKPGTGLQPVRAAAYRSPDFEKVFFIAMEFQATGISNEVGVWASNNIETGQASIMSIDGFAQEFTDWPIGSQTQAAISPGDPSVEKARACLNNGK